jgi:hypothetical protein
VYQTPGNEQYCFVDDGKAPTAVITTEDVPVGANMTRLDALTVTFKFSETVLLQSRDVLAMVESYPTADAWANLKVTNFTLDDRELRQTYSAVIRCNTIIASILTPF